LHVNDVAQVGSTLVHASEGRDALYQPMLRREVGEGAWATVQLVVRRARDVARLRHAFYHGGFTHVHVHYATFAHLAELGGVPFSVHLHGGDLLGDMAGGVKSLLVRRAIRRARRVVVSTPDLLARAQTFRLDAEYVPNPVARSAPSRPPIVHDQPHVMMLSKMDYLKGWDRQVQVMVDLRAAWPEMSFVFIAEGQLPSATKQDLSQRLIALGGTPLPLLRRDAYREQIRNADFAIGQMEVGALGMSELEALALGVVTVADARAHAGAVPNPPVVAPSAARQALTAIWDGGPTAHKAWAASADDYLRAHHDPTGCLRRLENLLDYQPGVA